MGKNTESQTRRMKRKEEKILQIYFLFDNFIPFILYIASLLLLISNTCLYFFSTND